MSEPVYVLSEQVYADLAELRADLLRRVKFHVMTAESASTYYWGQVKSIMRQGAHKESHDDRTVGVKCEDCGRTEYLPGSVLRYYCRCSPHQVRWSFKDRIALV